MKFVKVIKYHYLIVLLFIGGCIKNDIPYPIVLGQFLSFEVENQIDESIINPYDQTIWIELDELADPANVKVSDYTITENATIDPMVEAIINLTDSLIYTITTYQDYIWTIKANQSIERYFKLEHQVGNQIIDAKALTAKAFIAHGNDLTNVTIIDLKLGPPDAIYTPDPESIKDFTNEVTIKVSYRDIEEIWTLSVEHGDGIPGQDDADILELELAEQVTGSKTIITSYTVNSIEGFIDINVDTDNLYSLTISDLEISEGASSELSINDIIDLSSPRNIVVTAGSGKTKVWSIRAHPAIELKNRFFADWHQDGKVWNPYLISDPRYWCTGNEGVVTLSDSNTTPIEGENQGARLETISLGALGAIAGTPIAAGNIFIGDFKTNISNPAQSVKFGRPFTGRPKQLNCTFGYTPVVNELTADDVPMEKGDMDIGHIWIKVLHVSEETGEFDPDTHLPENAVIIGEGEYIIEGDHAAGSQQNIQIDYIVEHIDKTPTHLAIVATSSFYGEFFVGGVGSLLTVDEFELSY